MLFLCYNYATAVHYFMYKYYYIRYTCIFLPTQFEVCTLCVTHAHDIVDMSLQLLSQWQDSLVSCACILIF